MKNFRTVVTPENPCFQISYSDRIVSIGSCFSENIGLCFQEAKFNIHINPFGQQYNPHAIANAITYLVNGKVFTESDLTEYDGMFCSLAHHGSFSRPDKEEALSYMNKCGAESSLAIKEADVLMLTFGTATVFRYNATGEVVSNCHKMPSNYFQREMMSPNDIVKVMSEALESLWQVNPKVKVVFTVSPVRYFAFGTYENSVSKAHLFTALHQLKSLFSQICYFPAYELVIDDLRDYRFYSSDMIHPNREATEYVWQSMCDTFFSDGVYAQLTEVKEIQQALNHRPRYPDSDAHKKFLHQCVEKMKRISRQPAPDFSPEIERIEAISHGI